MLTEKTYCAIANPTMFIIAGSVGSLRLLKDPRIRNVWRFVG